MATIEKLGIQGIRSFGGDQEDFQSVRFLKPLTLILGPNGTGKTTIIECLKYAATGDMPPLCTRNGAFVHDPKLAQERSVKGKVKLCIKDVTGAPITIDRSVQATVKDAKGKKIEVKTLDGLITRVNREGIPQSLNCRCADLNREMIGALGVSKAVLENVIFCHQEDSSWPLTEGKHLKDKFDAIFASTRYSKSLDELKNIKKVKDVEIREGKRDLDYLRQHKEKAVQLRGDMAHLQEKLMKSEENVQQVEVKLQPVRERLEVISLRFNEAQELSKMKYKYTSEKEQIQKTIDELAEKIEEEITGSTDDLETQLNQFSTQVLKKDKELQECNKQQTKVTNELVKIEKDINRLAEETGKLQQEAETNKKKVKERDTKIKEVAELYEFSGFDDDQVSDEQYKLFFSLMKEKLQNMMEDAKRKKEEYEIEEKTLQDKIDSLRETKAKLENSEKMKRDNMDKNQTEMKELKQKLASMISSEGRLERLRTDLKRAENDLQGTESAVNADELRGEITELDRKKRVLEGEISEYNTEMNLLHKRSGAQAQLEMFQNDLKEKETTINRMMSTHEDSITSLIGHMPKDDLRESVDSFISDQNENVRKGNVSLRDLRKSLSTKEAEQKNTKKQLDQKEEELRKQEAKIYSVCEGQDLDESLNETKRNLETVQEQKGSTIGVEHMYTHYIKKLEKNNPDCPLCHRGFERAQEARELILKLQNEMRRAPATRKKAEEEIEALQEKHDQLMQLKPIKEMVENMKETEIPGLKIKLKKAADEVKKLKEDQQNKEDTIMALEMDLDVAKGLQPDIVSMDRYKGEARDLKRKIDTQKALLPKGGSDRTVDEVLELQQEKQLELDNINRNLDHKREKLSDHQERMQKLRSRVHDLKGEKLTIEGQLQQKTKLEERKVTLIEENAKLEQEVQEARLQLKPIEAKVNKAVDEKMKVTDQKERMMEEARTDVEMVKNKGQGVKTLNVEIRTYLQGGKAEQLESCFQRKSELKESQSEKENEKKKLSEKINELREDVTRQEIKKRCLEDTLTLRKKQAEVVVVQRKITEVQQKLGDMDVGNLQQERGELMEQEDAMREELHRVSGRQQGFKDQIKTLQKELNDDMYRDADKKYREQAIQIKTLQVLTEDLQKWYSATDRAIHQYHTDKMNEINQSIRGIWKRTYQGKDIEAIEIRAEDDDSTTSKMSARRSFNYRVVMIKNGIPIDMRGRCSAGQKVLACLIIRLALAETFCVNCGILALDEPTTNLDRTHIETLAHALVSIIKDRTDHHHLQLVVITHDEDFVELLGREGFVDEYIQVGKNRENKSRLEVQRVEELGTHRGDY